MDGFRYELPNVFKIYFVVDGVCVDGAGGIWGVERVGGRR